MGKIRLGIKYEKWNQVCHQGLFFFYGKQKSKNILLYKKCGVNTKLEKFSVIDFIVLILFYRLE